jgi:biopolymer transport protein ExbB/TolQ
MNGINVGVLDILKAGGLTLAILIVLSIYVVGTVWERWNTYKKSLKGLGPYLLKMQRAMGDGDLKEAAKITKSYSGAASVVVQAALSGPSGKVERRAVATRTLEREVASLEERLSTLGTIGSTAPFIGLFGTVMGVMRAFRDLATASNAGPGIVMLGISEALVATAAGLAVAIPAIIAYNYFTAKANSFNDEMRWVTDEILDRLSGKGH